MEGEPVADGNIPSHLERDVLIVYTGKFNSVDGPVEVDTEKLKLLEDTHNSFLTRLSQLFTGPIPIRNNPPLQLDHSTSAHDTVGRMTGPVSRRPHQLSDGSSVEGLFGRVRILGRENVEKYLDGRYSNVSIGADFNTGKISELTITPFPAAEEATLMTASQPQKPQGETMDPKHMEGMKHHLEGMAHHMGAYMDPAHKQEHMSSLEGLKKHLTEVGPHTEGPTAMKAHMEMMKKHLESMKGKQLEQHHVAGMKHHLEGLSHYTGMTEVGPTTEGQTSMKSQCEEMKKHLEAMTAGPPDATTPPTTPAKPDHKMEGSPAPDETKPEHMAAKLKDGLSRLAEMQKKMLHASTKMSLSTRLNQIKRLAKITPAELSKIDLDKLAHESEATRNAVLKSYEDREPIILAGMVGNAKAEDLSKLSKDLRVSRMMDEARQNMPLKRAEMENKLAANGQSSTRLSDAPPPKKEEMATSPDDTEMSKMEEEVNKLMEEGKVPEAKEKLKAYMEAMKKKHLASPEVHDDAHKEMSQLSADMTKLQSEMSGVVKLAAGA